MRPLLLALISFAFTLQLMAQSSVIEYSERSRYASYSSYTFNGRFNYKAYDFSINQSLVKQNKIRSITVLRYDSVFAASYTFDTAGAVLTHRDPWVGYEYITTADGKRVNVINYMDDNIVIRTDSTFFHEKNIGIDTACDRGYSVTYTYKRGSFINAQNIYYNQQYLNKKKKPLPFEVNIIYANGQITQPGETVYFSSPFKADYDQERMHLVKKMEEKYFGMCREYQHEHRIVNIHPEEEFNEPSELQEPMMCSNSTVASYSSQINEQGLPVKIFAQYTPMFGNGWPEGSRGNDKEPSLVFLIQYTCFDHQ